MSDVMMPRFLSVRPATSRVAKRRPFAALRIALRIYLTRQALPELTTRELADIGVSATAAATEAARLPWDTAPGARRAGGGILAAMQRAVERARTRRLLARLDARDLRDIAISRSDAQLEASKPFWQI